MNFAISNKKICFVQESGSLPSPSFICTIYVPTISEPELEQFVFCDGQWKEQELELA